MGEAAGLCDICGKPANPAFSCKTCGKRLCSNCITVAGVCRNCMGGRTIMEQAPPDLYKKMLE